jgi:hypothetical protein
MEYLLPKEVSKRGELYHTQKHVLLTLLYDMKSNVQTARANGTIVLTMYSICA